MPFSSVNRSEIAASYQRLCGRWAGASAATAAIRAQRQRLFGVFLAMPVALAGALAAALAAALGSSLPIGAEEVVTLALGVLALPMIFCGLLLTCRDHRPVGLSALATYALALAAIALGASSANLMLWTMAAAIPLEVRFIERSRRMLLPSLLAAGAVTVVLLAVASGHGGEVGLSAPALLGTFAYGGFVLARLSRSIAEDAASAASRADEAADMERALEGVSLVLGADGLLKSLSASAQEHFGVARNLLIGTPLFERVHVGDRVHYLSFLADLKDGAGRATAEVRLRCVAPADTGEHAHRVRFATYRLCAVQRSRGGGFLVVASDISQAVADRNALAVARSKVETAESAKNRFLSTVSHELRTPLNSIIGFSDILLQEICGKLPDSRQREYVELVHRSGNHLLSVVNSILDISRIEAGAYPITAEPFAFKEAVVMVSDMLGHQAQQKNVTLCDRVSPRIGTVVADRRAIQQVLINLVCNGVKFTEAGGVVTIDAQVEDGTLVFVVSDTGIGIDAADLATLCQPFRQVQNDYTRQQEGTGLGLATVKGLVHLHGGEMKIDSLPGRGTVVEVRLPLDGQACPAVMDDAALGQTGGKAALESAGGNIVEFKVDSDVKGGSHGEARKTA
ncbi:PAS domain-containing sensor histidine kinase [Phyllobacterium sp. 0TCS1.6C]|uniref:sensor histidine kinase n=1 Tax=unclassified Phyllobacterium TaxID=2638441 RepID=UPI00226448F9|nr:MULTISPECIES: PAS domain-containing sensor histidine kinase [unclassified Phyllobacterium]MCX8281289.1 PAS domain-containing sensor histidine kinase [Phyllobacterium sp. 0TCS1.6C]MCX8296055.1 PAS domain-containing sensor histidine kinase [Phyllobacterium sp. 0TCS1.6A]